MRQGIAVLLTLLVIATGTAAGAAGPQTAGEIIRGEEVARLPQPVTNNAVAALERNGVRNLYSFNGLGPGKTRNDTLSSAFEVNLSTGAVTRLPNVPGGKGRLASIAVGLTDRIFLFGGYTVAGDGSEKSTPEVFVFNPASRTYKRRADIPVPVDDTAGFAYAGRYIYLVSGWHDKGNVRLVQLYDTVKDKWLHATDYPGAPVFGHAGGIIRNQMIVSGGVKTAGEKDGKRQFVISSESWMGEIAPDDPEKITWTKLPQVPGKARYRAAAIGDAERSLVIFMGGSANPYNYNGIGYNGVPSEPLAAVVAYDPRAGHWLILGEARRSSMDHRGLLKAGRSFYTIGGMNGSRTVLDAVIGRTLPTPRR